MTSEIDYSVFTGLIEYGIIEPSQVRLSQDTTNTLRNLMNIVCPTVKLIPYEFKKAQVTWRAPVFKVTTTLKKELSEDEQILSNIRIFLNKLTDNTFLKISDNIEQELLKFKEDIPIDVANFIVDIATTNTGCVGVYAELYALLVEKFPSLQSSFMEIISKFTSVFDEIKYVDESNYDEFCAMTKKNKKRRALSELITKLTNMNVIDIETTRSISLILLKKFLEFINEEGKTNETDEISENLVILFNAVNKKTIINESKTLNDYIIEFSKYKSKDFKSLSNKTIFKFMDIVSPKKIKV